MLIHFKLVVSQHPVQNSYYLLPLLYIYLIYTLNSVESPGNQTRSSSLVQPRGLLSPIQSSSHRQQDFAAQLELAPIPLPIINLNLAYGRTFHHANRGGT